MRRTIFGAAILIGALCAGIARPVAAQPYDSGDRRSDRPDDRSGPHRDDDRRDWRDRDADHRDSRDREPENQNSHWRDADRRETYRGERYRRQARQYCAYEDGWHGRGSYWCGYAWRRGYGWAADYDGDGRYRGDHYRGYYDDGTGRRFYDRGGYGVGHCDYGGPRPWSC